jgi:hypothetical protein
MAVLCELSNGPSRPPQPYEKGFFFLDLPGEYQNGPPTHAEILRPAARMANFELNISFNSSGWGPINGTQKKICGEIVTGDLNLNFPSISPLGEKLDAFNEVPYAHFDKKDKCGKCIAAAKC